jgi:hypothetical protein
MSKMKVWVALVVIILCLDTDKADALSQNILKSPFVAKALACLNDLTEAGRKNNFQTDREGGTVLILNETQSPLHPLMVNMANCLDAALPKNEVVDRGTGEIGAKSRIWYAVTDDGIVWCASNSLDNNLENVNHLGGYGSQRMWYGVTFKCEIGDDILGWYTPDTQ